MVSVRTCHHFRRPHLSVCEHTKFDGTARMQMWIVLFGVVLLCLHAVRWNCCTIMGLNGRGLYGVMLELPNHV